VGAEDFQHYWWTNEVRDEMAGLITQMGLEACPVCTGQTLYVMPWPAIIGIGGLQQKAEGEAHEGTALFLAVVRCDACGHSMLFDSAKLTGRDQPPIWGGPGPPSD
jgi:hypothetical protein